jgi:ABC-type branched-subunit amino acid transport system ATPase component
MSQPKLMLIDEPSEGLAPVVQEIMKIIRNSRRMELRSFSWNGMGDGHEVSEPRAYIMKGQIRMTGNLKN